MTRKLRTAFSDQRPSASWLEWQGNRAIVNVRRVPLGREVLTGVKAARCPACSQVGVEVDGRWYHEIDTVTERLSDECQQHVVCPECRGTGRVPA